jgi:hypothetical protein
MATIDAPDHVIGGPGSGRVRAGRRSTPIATLRRRWPAIRRRVLGALVVAAVVLAGLYAWDDSRQPAAGSNWVLLGSRRVIGHPVSARIIATPADLQTAWDQFEIAGDAAQVDLGRSLVVWFTDDGSQGCPSRLDGISIDAAAHVVAGHFSRGFSLGCDDRLVPDSFLVLIDRSLLPTPPVRIQLIAQPPAGPSPIDATLP